MTIKKISCFVAWYDIWIGAFIDTKKTSCLPLPRPDVCD